ncbi:hypothetical protein ECP03022939_5009 [Escherichia coli P0302293.9]|nr:hypothetical protein ECP03023081_5026 [Escherichia coli P0302308.1]EMX09779.1 hypothetical protein ECP03022932_4952 [Escherichia coli P0302293.2]END18882.1 hypothetical protein ECP03023085_4823 [Escherichia coli P0302308.5]ENE17988.1 hypothetical protein ECP03022933_5187 [Escherichia coli P0302293.3]ENE31098.1 hypothetical protein ECP03022936_5077 [Escherichia coli P0302293.6]ENE33954.1 hypothetical protein ECP03022934_5309 [Escherichia coli P0302293.4]ENE42652.1 hypothetical protein ECP03
MWLRQLVILNFCFAMERLMLPDDACSAAYFHERRSLNNFHRDRVITFEQIAE